MLAKPHRLRKGFEIDRVYRKGQTTSAADFALRTLRNHQDRSRLVIVVGKKVSKKSVVRNRIRRRLSALLEAKWQTVAPGYDIVVTVRNDCSALSAEKLEQQLAGALSRARLTE